MNGKKCRICSWPPALDLGQAQGVPLDRAGSRLSDGSAIYAKHSWPRQGRQDRRLMQNDDYGRGYFNGFKLVLGKDATRFVQVATYEVADPTVDSQIIA